MKLIACRNLCQQTTQRKTVLIMKLTTVFLLATCLSVSAKGVTQEVTLSEMKAPLEKVFKKIQKQTGYSFAYTDDHLAKSFPITIFLRNASIEKVLDACFQNQHLSYILMGQTVVVVDKRQVSIVNTSITNSSPVPIPVNGRITDEKNNPVAGATVTEKGTGNSVVTKEDGSFTINTSKANATLVVSYVGYASKEIAVNSQSFISIALAQATAIMTDVVVVGYGTQRKRDVTAAVTSVKGKEIENLPVVSPVGLLQGRAAGVQINTNSGAPGATNMTIRVRGTASLAAGNNPLYIVDGMQMESNPSDINANDIQSIEILKDAAATAIYGSRGSNGVILITTKHGQSGKTSINLNYYTSIQEIDQTRMPDLMSADEFVELIQEQRVNGGVTSLYHFIYPDETGGPHNTNWVKEVTRRGKMDNYEISLSGGESKIRFYLSGGLLKQKGVIKHSDYQRFTSKLNLDYLASDKFKFGTNLNFSGTLNNAINTEDAFRPALWKAPVLPVRLADGNYAVEQDISNTPNPVAVADLQQNKTRTNRLLGNIFGEYTILQDLRFRTSWGIDIAASKNDVFTPNIAYRGAFTSGSTYNSFDRNWINENTVTYNKILGSHRLSGLLGYSVLENRREETSIAGRDYATNNITTLNAASIFSSASTVNNANGITSLFGRLGYTLADKYILQASLRRDGSSKFGENNRYALFPAFSLGWRFSDEAFFKSLSTIVNDFKLRVSYGKTGNQAGIGNYTNQGAYSTGINYDNQPGIAITTIPNPDLKWETTEQYNIGADFAFANSKVTLTVDVYQRNTSDLLQNTLLPSTSGFGSVLRNIGTTENKGIELDLNTININRDNFRWNTNFNISFNRNKIVKLYEGQDIIVSRGSVGYGQAESQFVLREGESIGAFYGWESKGVYAFSTDNKEGIRNSNSTGYLYKGGDMIFSDQNGDKIINNDDRVILGNALPRFTGGLTNNVSFKNFELNVLAQFSYGNEMYNGTRAVSERMNGFQNGTKNLLNRWRKEGDITDVPRADQTDGGLNVRASSRWIEDASYLRIKTLTLAYNLPSALSSKIKTRNVRIYATAQNLYTFTNYTGIDPESSYSNQAVYDLGFDYATYPQYRTILLGINVGF